MDKESAYELQKIDCNCNDCKFMDRDSVEFNLWKGFTEHLQYMEFLRSRNQLLASAGNCADEGNFKGAKVLETQARKMQFQFNKSQLTIQYGICLSRKGKWNQPVTFLPNTLQFDTQHCFEHRRESI